MKLAHALPAVARHFPALTRGPLIAGLALGVLLFSQTAVAYGEETTAEVLAVFNGCTITPPTSKSFAEVQGTCLGHTFSSSAEGLLPHPTVPRCYVSLSASRYWIVNNCHVDGNPALTISFHRKSRRLREITWIRNFGSVGQFSTKQEVFERDEQVETIASSALPIKCKPFDPDPSATEPSSASIYGLTLSEPLPCIDKCEAAGSKAPMCLTSGPKPTSWGTIQLFVRLNSDVFDFATTFKTGNPILELLDGQLVGVRFADIDPDFEPAITTQLSSKFGKFLLSGRTYLWTTPAASVRYSVSDHLTSGSLLGALLTGDAGNGAGTITIYKPSVRVLVQKYEDEQAKQGKKRGL